MWVEQTLTPLFLRSTMRVRARRVPVAFPWAALRAAHLVAEDTNTCPVFQVPGECADIFVHVETSG